MNYDCYGVNVIELSIRLKNCKRSHGIEIRGRDSIIIPFMIEENRAKFSLFHYESLEQGLPQGYKGLIVINLRVGMIDDKYKIILQ